MEFWESNILLRWGSAICFFFTKVLWLSKGWFSKNKMFGCVSYSMQKLLDRYGSKGTPSLEIGSPPLPAPLPHVARPSTTSRLPPLQGCAVSMWDDCQQANMPEFCKVPLPRIPVTKLFDHLTRKTKLWNRVLWKKVTKWVSRRERVTYIKIFILSTNKIRI